ncbi:MAG: aspartate kinase, partial [Ginsengibacter sp.]
CVDDIPEKIEKIAQQATGLFDVQLQRNLSLLTIRHYSPKGIDEFINGRKIILEQKTIETVQLLLAEN